MIKPLQISTAQVHATLTPAQKKFNATLKKIAAQQTLLADWQTELSAAQNIAIQKIEPLKQAMRDHQAAMITMLDNAYKTEKFTYNQQDKISSLIMAMCAELIEMAGRDELKPVYNQYSASDYDTEVAEDNAFEAQLLQDIFAAQYGMTLDADDELDLTDPDRVAARLHEKCAARAREAEAQSNNRKKTAKQLAQEAREQAESTGISKSIQAVYRQLATALHPDREPDPVERERKTALMQQVNVAYSKKDLLQLLALQLSVAQINQDNINTITEDKLKHYNKVLTKQLSELQEEVVMLEMQVRQMLNLDDYMLISPKKITQLLKQDIHGLQNEIARIQYDIRAFSDVKYLKSRLKSYQPS
ncbi:MAG: molecular chaperone DnaJ [Sulfuriferula sp.]|nr:molecular chaperone DnaJ [Sulfuriferula sp.]